MKVKCINDGGIGNIAAVITSGRTYEVVNTEINFGEKYYKIIANDLKVRSMLADRFEIVQEKQSIYKAAVKEFGDSQLDIVQEEAAELIQAISKYKRNKTTHTRINVLEEMSDVYIMLEQLKILINVTDTDVSKMINKKQIKLESYLNKRCAFDE